MPRDGSGKMVKPPGTTAEPLTTIQSAQFNSFADDVVQDLNTPRPITVGGTGAGTLAQAQANLGLVPQASTTDTTTGRLMKNGAFGLGGNAPTQTAPLTNNLYTGFLREGTNPGDDLRYRVAANADEICDLIAVPSAGTLAVHMRTGGAWQTARGLFHRGDILGTVSQSGGVPTGKLIETGSNANGSYVRFANGAQICTHSIDLGDRKALGAGTYDNPWRTAISTWTFPIAFWTAADTVVQITPHAATADLNVRAAAAHYRTISTTEVTGIVATALTSNATSISLTASLMAIGRWF